MKNMTKAALAATALVSMWAGDAAAQTKISIGCTATTDCASSAVALQEGIFKKNGLDVTMVLIGINSTIPAALLSNSLQIGGPTPPTFLQAVDGGLELVAVAGASATAPSTVDTVAVVATAASGIKGPKDFVGKKVGSPGIGAFLQVLFSKWLIENGVDPKKVNFVEVGFPTMNDALKSNAVDAVITAEPIMSRIIASGTGTAAGYFLEKLPERRPQILYSSTRAWADANAAALKAFRTSIEEGAKIANENPDKGRKAIADFTKIPMDVLSKQKLTTADAKIDKEQLDWWVSTMNEQNMLQGKPDTAALIQK
ncbi:ABC transporter substrate-binding protein [Neorhizobium vignae]|uniref:ABC transporter substrate-binding protein n=1 Tax=Neorhizobium vignae TaxID=690585 RepID=UPI000689C800|nr:ABC transporter substrate-binding protein [Neorhizobium vignae]